MFIETTIYINVEIHERLTKASTRTGESKRNIVSSLLCRLSFDYEEIAIPWKRIAYQKRDRRKAWQRLHLTLVPDEYEFFLDLRKAYKLSVSHLVAYAMDKYLDEIVGNFLKGTGNYRYSNYTLSCFVERGVVCLIHYWGLADTLLSHNLLQLLGNKTFTFSSA
jgi:hypothetical protein